MKRIAAGILAHVDAGKTTLSEGLLYCAGEIRSLGRVDNQNTFLDTDEIERSRGITVFSKQAVLTVDDTQITLLDTPGHIDFAAEAERTLAVLDYATLVISATDGIQGHTKTLWDLLKKHNIPVFIFINKLDLDGAETARVMDELSGDFGGNFIDFCNQDKNALCENLAMCNETLMQMYLESGKLDEELVKKAIKCREVFPVFSGTALKMQGVEEFLKAFARLTVQSPASSEFGAKVFKIGQDDKGQRLTYMKITGGTLRVKDVLRDEAGGEKVNEIRIYSGDKYQSTDAARAGCVCAVTGPAKTYAGQGLGFERDSEKLTAEPIFSYRLILPEGVDAATAMSKLRQLEQEETQLYLEWNEQLKEIQLRLMGEIQLEVLKQIISKRFDMDVEFEEGHIVYKETIETRTEGVGHYEPLRHYAEVHLVLEPLPRGSGMQFVADCAEDVLDKNWQRLIMTHLMEKPHLGVLTGSPVTDIKITLKTGRAHLKHTEGGDFRQATYRAVRHGLRCAKSVLLEPYYDFVLEIPDENVGRAMTDLNFMGAEFTLPHSWGGRTRISGSVAAEQIRNYHKELVGYTHGKGKLNCKFRDYGPCKDADAVIEKIGYNADADVENTADSVFCAHGAGFTVKWNEVTEYMHLESVLKPKRTAEESTPVLRSGNIYASDEELLKIFERTYGKVERKNPNHTMRTPKAQNTASEYTPKKKKEFDKEYLLIDGYNIIFAWDYLKKLAGDSLEAARSALTDRISAYKIFRDCEIILVFDAYKVKGNPGEAERVNGITVVYTKEAQTADSYIEKAAKELSRNYKVTVATSDGLEQMIIFGSGAYRLPARALLEDVLRVEARVREIVEQYNIESENTKFLKTIRDKMEELEMGIEE
ncbi:MAG: TetM/TetW/TetO/TetS family tetracycline resistance ribosomal protection protein [Clostridia bacterium]|nr:TetM/TetW/TetO/TetS family tetracycline resistance ribosomal protection protein [Clostridia bacterium]